jgi:hypothetical protein
MLERVERNGFEWRIEFACMKWKRRACALGAPANGGTSTVAEMREDAEHEL